MMTKIQDLDGVPEKDVLLRRTNIKKRGSTSCSSHIITILAPNIFFCLQQGLVPFIVLLAPFFSWTRQIHYRYPNKQPWCVKTKGEWTILPQYQDFETKAFSLDSNFSVLPKSLSNPSVLQKWVSDLFQYSGNELVSYYCMID